MLKGYMVRERLGSSDLAQGHNIVITPQVNVVAHIATKQ